MGVRVKVDGRPVAVDGGLPPVTAYGVRSGSAVETRCNVRVCWTCRTV